VTARPGTHTLIYDGACRLCRRSVEWVRARDRDERIRALPYQDPEVAGEFPGIPRDELESAMQLVAPDGNRRQGADAVEGILELLPGWKALAPGFAIPGVRRLAARVYRWVARNRRSFGCGSHCGLPNGGRSPHGRGPGGTSRPGGI
jgi:predicted DCC family thiol-disulfide oxidoreductase YuxK